MKPKSMPRRSSSAAHLRKADVTQPAAGLRTAVHTTMAAPGKGPWMSLGAALLAAVGAGLCCAGPLLYLLFGVSAATFGLFSWPLWLQWPLTAGALFFWALVLYRLYFSARPVCATGIHRYLRPTFWLISCIIGVLLSYPYWVGWLFFA